MVFVLNVVLIQTILEETVYVNSAISVMESVAQHAIHHAELAQISSVPVVYHVQTHHLNYQTMVSVF